MITAELIAEIEAMPKSRRAEVIRSIVGPLEAALAAFARQEIGESELISVELAVNDALASLPSVNPGGTFTEAARALRERMAELRGTLQ